MTSPDFDSFCATPRGKKIAAKRMHAGADGVVAFEKRFNTAKEAFCGAGQPTPSRADLKSRLVAPVRLHGQASPTQALLTFDTSGPADKNADVHYMACHHNGALRGGISSNDTNGLHMHSSAGDFAEWHEQREPHEKLMEGHVVGFQEGKVGLCTSGSHLLGVVSARPIVLGSAPASSAQLDRGVAVAYCGRVPVRVRGPVCAGDILVASGHSDGFARVQHSASLAGGDTGCDSQCDLGVLGTVPGSSNLGYAELPHR